MVISIDKRSLIEKLLVIDNKEGKVVPFKPNKVQNYFLQNKGHRNIILKARQLGVTSIKLADMFIDCITIPHMECAVVSHETRATQKLLDKVQFYYDCMGNPKPVLGAESRSEKTFPELHSSIYIGTAGSRAFGRGSTLRNVLLSEIAFYEDGERLLSGVEDAVPITGELTLESTANGEDNVFYEKWTKAREGKSPYKPFFFPWWLGEDYSIPRGSELALPEDQGELTYTGEELALAEQAHLTEDQIRWRRFKIAEKGGLFWIEYPENEVDCWITTGDPVFDPYVLTSMAQGCFEGTRHEQGWTFWLPPESNLRYTIGADSSAGSPGGSYSAAVVLDDYWRVCATFQARLEPHTFAAILKQMASWYNQAEIAVERNFTGYAVLGHLQDYGNLYHQRDFLTGKILTNLGWWTNEQTKQYMMTVTKDNLSQLKIYDVNLVRQLRSYRYIKHRPTAQSFDDLAIALMIACAVKKVSGGARGFMGSSNTWSW